MESEVSVGGLANRLLGVSQEYLHHFDPGAPLDVSVIRLELSGPNLTLVFSQVGTAPPSLQLTLHEVASTVALVPHEDTIAASQKRASEDAGGFFRRG